MRKVIYMALLQQWREMAYSPKANKGDLQRLWAAYFDKEKEIYQKLLKKPDTPVTGTVKALAKKLITPNPIEQMEEDTEVSLAFDKELLYKNMVGAKADWLYELEEWKKIFDEDKLKELYKEQKISTTVVKDAKIFPNDSCPCGSGKKYKKCCGKA